MANSYFYSNTAVETTLTGSIAAGSTSIAVGSTGGFPSGTFPYVLALDYGGAAEELVTVTGAAGLTLTVTRGFGGTSAQSHSLGAVVRHVVNAVDLTDFRTHEASTGAVHGLTGSIVGTSDTQTLTNKTLTSPTINAGALSGTFTGTPTHSGAQLFTGAPTFQAASAAAATAAYWVSGDTVPRLAIVGSGQLQWSGGSSTADAILYREASSTLATLGLFRSYRSAASSTSYSARVTGDSQNRLDIQADGAISWGAGGASAPDTTLYRSAASTLKTDDSLVVAGELSVTGGTTWTTYTPTVTNGGAVTWSTRTGYYHKIGKLVFVVVYLTVNVAGTGASNVAITMPTNVDRTTRQVLGFSAEGVGLNGHGHVVFFTGGTAGTSDRLRAYDGQNMIGSDLLAGGIITVQGWYREA